MFHLIRTNNGRKRALRQLKAVYIADEIPIILIYLLDLVRFFKLRDQFFINAWRYVDIPDYDIVSDVVLSCLFPLFIIRSLIYILCLIYAHGGLIADSS